MLMHFLHATIMVKSAPSSPFLILSCKLASLNAWTLIATHSVRNILLALYSYNIIVS